MTNLFENIDIIENKLKPAYLSGDLFQTILDPFQISLFILNIIVLFSTSSIIKKISPNNEDDEKIKRKRFIFFFFSILLLVSQLIYVGISTLEHYQIIINNNFSTIKNLILEISETILVVYGTIFTHHILQSQIIKNFGDSEKSEDGFKKIKSYKTRMMSLGTLIVLSFLALILIINVWHFESALGTTGVVGIIVGFLAITSSIYGPDLWNGIVLIYSKLMEEGHLIHFEENFYLVYKVTPVETILFNIKDNSRTTIRNKFLGDKEINNLTKIAHNQGYRVSIVYKIGYPVDFNLSKENRQKQLQNFKHRLNKLIEKTFEDSITNEDVLINKNYPIEVHLLETGDYALHYRVCFYQEPFEKTNSTVKAKKFLRSREVFNEIFFENSIEFNIDLSTPSLHILNNG